MKKINIQIELREELTKQELELACWEFIKVNPMKIASAKLITSSKSRETKS